jgi:hypothetical protein
MSVALFAGREGTAGRLVYADSIQTVKVRESWGMTGSDTERGSQFATTVRFTHARSEAM